MATNGSDGVVSGGTVLRSLMQNAVNLLGKLEFYKPLVTEGKLYNILHYALPNRHQ